MTRAGMLLPYARTTGVRAEPNEMIRIARTVRCFAALASLAVLPVVCLPAAAATVAPAAGVVTKNDSFVGELLAIVLPMAFIIIALLFLLRALRRRYGLAGRDSPLSVLQILPVGPRERVVLLQSRAGRVFAIGVGGQNVTFITDLDMEDIRQPPDSAAGVENRAGINIANER